MAWVVVGTTIGAGYLGMQQAKRQHEAQQEQNKAAAAQTQYSPWTGLGAGKADYSPAQSGLEGALSGAMKGYMTGNSIANSMGGSAPETPASPEVQDAQKVLDSTPQGPMSLQNQPNSMNMVKKKTLFDDNTQVLS